MTPSEFAFLALGLLLGIATGGAIVVVFNSHPPTHEIRVTVARDAIPRRASTLAADAIPGGPAGPAPGGPGDRREADRESGFESPADRTIVRPARPIVAAPTLPWLLAPEPRLPPEPALRAAPVASRRAVAIEPEADPVLVALGVAVPGQFRSDPLATVPGATPTAPGPVAAPGIPGQPLLAGVLAGSPIEMGRLVAAVAGEDPDQHDAWDELVGRFVAAVRQRALALGYVNVPLGNPFWDAFTIEQCRQIVASLASSGRRFDGRSGWADGLVPTYRDLARAAAESGIEPLRIRAWPNSQEIAELFRGASVAAGEAVADAAPTLAAAELREFLGDRDAALDPIWQVWDAVRAALLAESVAPA